MTTTTRDRPLLNYLSLFTSLGTLVCCALPSLLVLLGLGATVAFILSAAPWLVTLSRQKALVFTISGVLVATNFIYVYLVAQRMRAQQTEACSLDNPGACEVASRTSRALLWLSAVIYLVGFFVAYVLGPMLERFA